MPPAAPPADAPAPAPTLPSTTGAGRRPRAAAAAAARPKLGSGRCRYSPPRPRSNRTAVGTMGTTRVGSSTDEVADAVLLEPRHHPVGGGQSIGAATGQAHRVDVGDEVAWIQGVGLPGTRPSAADVDRGRRCRLAAGPRSSPCATPVRSGDGGRRGCRDVGQVVARSRRRCRDGRRGHLSGSRRSGTAGRASRYTSAASMTADTSTYSSIWWAIHFPPGPYTTLGMPVRDVSTVPSVAPGTPPSRAG